MERQDPLFGDDTTNAPTSDQSDTASNVEALLTRNALQRQLARGNGPKPREDGLCACGCGEEVDPRRLALGLGLTIDCARLREARSR